MDIKYTARRTRPVTHPELMRFVQAADNEGEPSIGTAAMIAFFWLQRQIDILSRLMRGERSPLMRPFAHCCICSGKSAAALVFGKSPCSLRNTARHRSTVDVFGLASFTHRSNSAHGVKVASGAASYFGNCSAHLSGP